MICNPCAAGGDLTREPAPQLAATAALARQLHGECAGCTCQHVVPDRAGLAERRAAMPRGGLARVARTLAAS